MSVEVHRTANGYEAQAVVATKWGPVLVRGVAPTGWVDEAMRLLLSRRPDIMASGGDLFGDIAKTFGQVAKSKAFGDVSSVVAQVASNPLAQTAVTAFAGPAGGAALQGVGMAAAAANSLAGRARAGHPDADRDVRAIAAKAKAGDPKAIKAAKMLREAFHGMAAKDAVTAAAARPAPGTAPAQAGPVLPFAQLVDFAAYRAQMGQQPQPSEVAAQQMQDGSWSLPSW